MGCHYLFTPPPYQWQITSPHPKKVKYLLRNVLHSDGNGWGIAEALGPCPPDLYSWYEPFIINPYRRRDEDRLRMLQPALNGINEFMIKPLLKDLSIIYSDPARTDPKSVYDFKAPAGLDELTAEPPAPVGQFRVWNPTGIQCDGGKKYPFNQPSHWFDSQRIHISCFVSHHFCNGGAIFLFPFSKSFCNATNFHAHATCLMAEIVKAGLS